MSSNSNSEYSTEDILSSLELFCTHHHNVPLDENQTIREIYKKAYNIGAFAYEHYDDDSEVGKRLRELFRKETVTRLVCNEIKERYE